MFKFIDSLLLGIDLRSQRARLAELDDRLLADIGLTRDAITTRRRRK